jgi:hypothetical protein
MHRPGDVFEVLFAAVLEGDIEAALDVLLHPRRNADAAGIGEALQPSGDVDAVAKNVAVVQDDVADMNADPQFDPLGRRDIEIGAGHRQLDIDRATRGIDRAGKFRQHAVAGGLDDAAAMLGDFRIDQADPMMFELRERALLVQPHQPAVTGDIGSQDGRQPSIQALACQIRLPDPRRELYRISQCGEGNSGFHRRPAPSLLA